MKYIIGLGTTPEQTIVQERGCLEMVNDMREWLMGHPINFGNRRQQVTVSMNVDDLATPFPVIYLPMSVAIQNPEPPFFGQLDFVFACAHFR